MIKFSNRLFRKKRMKPWQRKSNIFASRKSYFFKKNKSGFYKNLKFGLLALSIFLIVYFIFFSEFFIIKKIDIKGNNIISKESVEKIIKNENSNLILKIFKKDNFFLSDKEKIKKKLLDEFQEIKTITVEKKIPDTIEVEITEKIPLIIWCRIGNCYYLDSKGIAFMAENNGIEIYKEKRFIKIIEESEIKEEAVETENKNKITEDGGKIKYLNGEGGRLEIKKDKDGREYYEKETENKVEKIYLNKKEKIVLNPIKINDKVADEDFIRFIFELDNNIKNDTDLIIKYYKTKGVRTRELIAYTDKNVRIYFNAMDSAKSQTTYLKDFIFKGIGKNKINTLEYIYLKSGNKIFYK